MSFLFTGEMKNAKKCKSFFLTDPATMSFDPTFLVYFSFIMLIEECMFGGVENYSSCTPSHF